MKATTNLDDIRAEFVNNCVRRHAKDADRISTGYGPASGPEEFYQDVDALLEIVEAQDTTITELKEEIRELTNQIASNVSQVTGLQKKLERSTESLAEIASIAGVR